MLAILDEAMVADMADGSPWTKRMRSRSRTLAEFARVLRRVRRDGYAIRNKEAFIGDLSTAAGVFNEAGDVMPALNIAVSLPRWSASDVKRQLRRWSSTITEIIGFATA